MYIALLYKNKPIAFIHDRIFSLLVGGFVMIALFVFLFGLVIGSFLNVCIYRLPRGESIVNPPSHCMLCGTTLKTWDLVPVISYLLLKGRCRYCKNKFSVRYLAVELLTAFLFGVNYYLFGLSIEFLKASMMLSFLIIISFIDYDYQLIYDKFLLWFLLSGLVMHFLLWQSDLINISIGFLVGGLALFIVAIVSRGGMGGGDIKLSAVLGVWLGWPDILLMLFIAFILGGIISLLLLIFKIKKRSDVIPFGPFIALGGYITLTLGRQIIFWYLSNWF